MSSVYSERQTEFARTAAKIFRFFGPAVLDHQFDTFKRLHRTDENGFPPPGNSGCYVEAIVNTVDKVNVSQTTLFEHGMVPFGSSAEGMACRVVLGVSLGFYYYTGYKPSVSFPSQKAANNIGGKNFSASAEKIIRGRCIVLQNSPPVS